MEIAVHGESMELQLEELKVKPNASLIGSSLKEAEVRRKLGVIIVAIEDATGKLCCEFSYVVSFRSPYYSKKIIRNPYNSSYSLFAF